MGRRANHSGRRHSWGSDGGEWTIVQRRKTKKAKGTWIACGKNGCRGYTFLSQMAEHEVECKTCHQLYEHRDWLSPAQQIHGDCIAEIRAAPSSGLAKSACGEMATEFEGVAEVAADDDLRTLQAELVELRVAF